MEKSNQMVLLHLVMVLLEGLFLLELKILLDQEL